MKTLSNIGYYVLIAVICGIGLLVLSSLMPVQGTIAIKVVKSGSMEPGIHVGSVVVDKPEPVYNIGDVVTFGVDTKTQVPTTHRIVGITGEGVHEMITTKGDANNSPDQNQTPMSQVHGKVILTIPYLGYILAFAKTKLGFIFLVAFPAFLICIEEVYKIVQEVRRLRSKKRKVTFTTRAIRANAFAAASPEPHERKFVMDLRPKVRREEAFIVGKPGLPRAGQAIVAGLSIVFVMTMASLSWTSGNTVAYYAQAQVSTDNVLKGAANFSDPPSAAPGLIFAGVQNLITGGPDTAGDTGTTTPDASSMPETPTPTSLQDPPPTGSTSTSQTSVSSAPTTDSGSTTPDIIPPPPPPPAPDTSVTDTPPIDPPAVDSPPVDPTPPPPANPPATDSTPAPANP